MPRQPELPTGFPSPSEVTYTEERRSARRRSSGVLGGRHRGRFRRLQGCLRRHRLLDHERRARGRRRGGELLRRGRLRTVRLLQSCRPHRRLDHDPALVRAGLLIAAVAAAAIFAHGAAAAAPPVSLPWPPDRAAPSSAARARDLGRVSASASVRAAAVEPGADRGRLDEDGKPTSVRAADDRAEAPRRLRVHDPGSGALGHARPGNGVAAGTAREPDPLGGLFSGPACSPRGPTSAVAEAWPGFPWRWMWSPER